MSFCQTTMNDIWKKNLIEHKTKGGIIKGVISTAATQTTFIWKGICFDAGWVPQDTNIRILLLTHMHSDHSRDLMNVVSGNDKLIIFCPASVAINLFKMIKLNITMQKGRIYNDNEIKQMVTVYGCKKSSKEREEKSSNIIYVENGHKIHINLKGQESVYIEHFPCCHTIDTVGYMVYDIRKCLAKTINIPENKTYIINMTEDQKYNKDKVSDRFSDIKEFRNRHDIQIDVSIRSVQLNNNHILYQRHINFPNGMELKTMDDGKCILSPNDIKFLKRYNINIRDDIVIPRIMFFGDTSSRVFDNKRVLELIDKAETVIIESTYLNTQEELGAKKYKKHKKKRHMFLHELIPIIRNHTDTQFLLCHFSACYDRTTILERIEKIKCSNVKAFI